MQEDNKVELDIDDVKEEDVTIDAKPAEEKPEKVDVDLGYTDPIKKDTKIRNNLKKQNKKKRQKKRHKITCNKSQTTCKKELISSHEK